MVAKNYLLDNQNGGSLRRFFFDGAITDSDIAICIRSSVLVSDSVGLKLAYLLMDMSEAERKEISTLQWIDNL